MMTRISVCMATYNGERFVAEQLQSILNQLGPDDEVVISDDGSTDNTINIVRAFGDSRLRLLAGQSFRSVVLNFENALKYAKGEYIFLADQDDVWLPNKVDRMLTELQVVDLVVSDCTFVDETGQIIGASYFNTYNSGRGVVKNFIKNTYLGNCMAFRRSVLSVILPFPASLCKASKLSLYHDVWIGILVNILFRVRFIPEVLSAYRRHSANASPTEMSAKSSNSFSKKLKARYLLAISLIGRLFRIA